MLFCLGLWGNVCLICAALGWFLLMRVDIDPAFDAFLTHIGPAIATAPFTFTFWAFELTETSFLALVRGQAFR